MTKVNLAQKLKLFQELWKPKIVAQVNDFLVKVVKLKGEFVWHHHKTEDELFMVLEGSIRILLKDEEIVLNEGELVVIPKGIEHCPVADREASVLLFESSTVLNTGNVRGERTVDKPEQI
jgi:mannose-6-phosphate isomerase-like protein (cupin superfamily)